MPSLTNWLPICYTMAKFSVFFLKCISYKWPIYQKRKRSAFQNNLRIKLSLGNLNSFIKFTMDRTQFYHASNSFL